MSDGTSVPPTPKPSTLQRYLHAGLVGFVSGALAFASGALAVGITTGLAFRALLIGTLTAGLSRALGAWLSNWTRDNPEP
jgi:hypothetical protein